MTSKKGKGTPRATTPDSTAPSVNNEPDLDVEALKDQEPVIEPSPDEFAHLFEHREVCEMVVSADGNRAKIAVPHGEDEVLAVVQLDDGEPKNIYKGGTVEDKLMILRFLLQAGPDSIERAQRNFEDILSKAVGRGAQPLDMLVQSIEFALNHGNFDCAGAPQDRTERDELLGQPESIMSKEAQQIEALVGRGNLIRITDVARGRGCSNRTAFRIGIENALSQNML